MHFIILHGGSVLEITSIDYLFRVVLSLFAFSGIAAIVFWGLDVISAIHPKIVENRSSEENDL